MAATIVLVHGAWHGAWCFSRLLPLIEAQGISAVAIDLPGHGESSEPLGDLHSDAAAVSASIDRLDAPDGVVLLGHSYGGAVISEAGVHPNVRHLVYLCAFVLDETESLMATLPDDPEVKAISYEGRPNVLEAFQFHDDGTSTLDPALAGGVLYNLADADTVAWAVPQLGAQPMITFGQSPPEAAWRTTPSTYVVGTEDMAIHPTLQRAMSRRCTTVVEWTSDHSPFATDPERMADLLVELALLGLMADPDADPGAGHIVAPAARRATNLELFLDLVFVFAVTQVAGVFAADPTPVGFVRGLLLAWLVWWLWSQFAWLGTVVDLDHHPVARLLVLAAVPPTLLVAVAIPHAHDDAKVLFAVMFLIVQLWCLAIQGQAMWGEPALRRAWLQYAPLAALAPCLLIVGAVVLEGPRLALWGLVAVFDIAAARTAGRERSEGATEWHVDPGHFAERHALFIIISLGEVLVTVGATANGTGLTWEIGVGLVTTVTLACVLWWTYFAYVSGVAERVLASATGAARGRVARDLFSFGHFPIVLGVVMYAVTVHHLVAEPLHSLDPDLTFLALAIALFFGGFMGLHWQVGRKVAPERPVAIVACALLCAVVGPAVASVVLVAAITVVVGLAQSITIRRYNRNLRAEAELALGTENLS